MSETTTDHHLYPSQVAFADGQPQEGSPETLFPLRPTRSFLRKFFNQKLKFPDGAEFEIWSFEDDTSGRRLPAPLVRVTEGDIVHGTIKPSKSHHTIHWHGIEPDPRNDGVGHTSFEVSGEYTYQWLPQLGQIGEPNVGSAGTYFYHCHVNTTLHVQMGMFGALVVDPAPSRSRPSRPGARRAFVDGPEYDIATETIIVPYAVDPRWHTLEHAAGLSGEDVGLNRFEPTNFYLLGGLLAAPPTGQEGVSTVTAVTARVTDGGPSSPLPTLLRLLNAGYHPTRLQFFDPAGRPAAIGEVIGHDGRQYRDTSSPNGASPPLRDVGRRILSSALAFGAAERYEILLTPSVPGRYTIRVDFIHWVTGRILGTKTIPLTVT
jgi:plastocyanin